VPLEAGTLEILAATPRVLRALLTAMPPAVLDAPDPGGWSARDVVAHLVDRGRIQRARVERLLEHAGATIDDRDEHESLEASGLRPLPLEELLGLFERERAADFARYSSLRAHHEAVRGTHSVAGEISVANLVNQAAYHDAIHIAQIANALAAAPAAGRGAFAMFA
jgi:hypothetical protein